MKKWETVKKCAQFHPLELGKSGLHCPDQLNRFPVGKDPAPLELNWGGGFPFYKGEVPLELGIRQAQQHVQKGREPSRNTASGARLRFDLASSL